MDVSHVLLPIVTRTRTEPKPRRSPAVRSRISSDGLAGRLTKIQVSVRRASHGHSSASKTTFTGPSLPRLARVALSVADEHGVAELDLAAAVQVDAEGDADGIGRDPGGDLVAGPVAGSGDGGEVVLGIAPGIRWRRSPSLAGDAEYQSGALGDVGAAQVAAEGDGVAAVVLGLDFLAEAGESGGLGRGGRSRSPARPRWCRN